MRKSCQKSVAWAVPIVPVATWHAQLVGLVPANRACPTELRSWPRLEELGALRRFSAKLERNPETRRFGVELTNYNVITAVLDGDTTLQRFDIVIGVAGERLGSTKIEGVLSRHGQRNFVELEVLRPLEGRRSWAELRRCVGSSKPCSSNFASDHLQPAQAMSQPRSAFVPVYMLELLLLLSMAYESSLSSRFDIGHCLCGLFDVAWSVAAVGLSVVLFRRLLGVVAARFVQIAACILAAADVALTDTLDMGLNAGVLSFGMRVALDVSNSIAILTTQLTHLLGGFGGWAWLSVALSVAMLQIYAGLARHCDFALESRFRGALARWMGHGVLVWSLFWPLARKLGQNTCSPESCSVFMRLLDEMFSEALVHDRATQRFELRTPQISPMAVRSNVDGREVEGVGTNMLHGVVILVLESVSADAVTPLYAGSQGASGQRRSSAPFLSWLAAQEGSVAGPAHFSSIPNTNKMLLESICGIAPEPATSWDEFKLREQLSAECLPELWRRAVNGTSLFVSSSTAPPNVFQRQLGFDVVMDAADLRRACSTGGSFARRCNRLHVRLTSRCVKNLHKRRGNSMRARLLSLLRSAAASPNATEVACGHLDAGPAMNESHLRECLDDPCIDELHGGAAPTGWHYATNATGDMQIVEPTLDFAAAAAAKRRPFFTYVLTTATHYPYHPAILERGVRDNGTRSKGRGFAGRYYDGLRREYLDRVQESDELVKRLFVGLRHRGLEKTLFIVVGDHGEGFHEDGTSMQHGSCVSFECMRVPFVMHDPLRISDPTHGRTMPPASSNVPKPAWLSSLTRHADIQPTVLQWIGYSLSASTAEGDLRPVRAIGAQNSTWQRCIPIFGFFDQRRRAVACPMSTSAQVQQTRSTKNAGAMQLIGYSMHDPRRRASPSHLVLPVVPGQKVDWRWLGSLKCSRARREFRKLGRHISATRQLYARWRKLALPLVERADAAAEQQHTYRSLMKTQLVCLVTSMVEKKAEMVPEGC